MPRPAGAETTLIAGAGGSCRHLRLFASGGHVLNAQRPNRFQGPNARTPVAAALSTGVAPEQFGAEIDDEVRLPSLETPLRIIHIDRFGNCVTNIRRETFEGKSLKINGKTISAVRNFYGEASAGEVFAIWGSAGFLEISVNGGSAAQILGAKRGDAVSFT